MLDHITSKQQLNILQKLYKHSLKAKFYRDRFSVDDSQLSFKSWQELPIMEKQDLFDNAYPRSSDMLTTKLENMIVLSTGGSSGVARYTLMSHEEWGKFGEVQAQTLQMLGVQKSDRVANLFIAGHLWPSFLGVHEIIKDIGAVHLPISANIPIEDIMQLCIEFEPTVMVSLPTLFVFLADMAKKEGIKFSKLKMILYAGEQMSQQAQEHVKKYLGVEKITALAYSSADAGLMGYKCDSCGFGTYHIPTAFQYIEVVNPQTGEISKNKEMGDIIVTNLERFSMPIVRYRIGDIGYKIDEPCLCGDPNPLFHLGGRSGDDFKLGGAFISMDVFEQSVAEFDDFISLNYTVTLEDIKEYMIITLSVETSSITDAKTHIETSLRDMLIDKINEIKVGLKLNYIREFNIEFVELGSLKRNPRTGKVKHLHDKRVQGDNKDESH